MMVGGEPVRIAPENTYWTVSDTRPDRGTDPQLHLRRKAVHGWRPWNSQSAGTLYDEPECTMVSPTAPDLGARLWLGGCVGAGE